MSWILGVVAEDSDSDLFRRVIEANRDAASLLERKGILILAGKKSLTYGLGVITAGNSLNYKKSELQPGIADGDRFMALAGTAILSPDSGILSDSEMLKTVLAGSRPGDIHGLQGQFAAVRSVENDLELFCDNNSLRSLYMVEQTGMVLFSTHVDRIIRVTGTGELDFHAFGSHWLAHNQISNRFFLTGISRIYGSGRVRISRKKGRIRTMEVAPEKSGCLENKSDCDTSESATDVLGPFIRLIGTGDRLITLALSGGVDSRYLLAALLHHHAGKFSAFIFGSPADPEVQIVQKLTRALSVSLDIVPDITDLAELLVDDRLESFTREHFRTTPISAAGRLLQYEAIQAARDGAVVLDGAFGEYGRAQFYRRIELLRRLRFLRRFRPSDIERSLGFSRVSVFSDDARHQMQSGFREDSECFFDELMSIDNENSNSVVRPEDTMGIRFRRKNFFGFGQAWIDNWCSNAMPFGQNDTIRRLRQIPLSKRRGGAFFRSEIRRMAPAAAEVPLAKSGTIYSFSRSSNAVIPATRKLFSEIRRYLPDEQATDPANQLRKWVSARNRVYDIFHSQSSSTFAGYDKKPIDDLLDDVFRKGINRTNELDWLLSFELWRTSVRIS